MKINLNHQGFHGNSYATLMGDPRLIDPEENIYRVAVSARVAKRLNGLACPSNRSNGGVEGCRCGSYIATPADFTRVGQPEMWEIFYCSDNQGHTGDVLPRCD